MNSVTRNIPIKTAIIILIIYVTVCLLSESLYAQKLPALSPSKETTAPVKQEAALDDPLGRSTPQGTLLGFMKDVNRENYERAAECLDTKQPPRRAYRLASQLQTILNQGLSGNLSKLSNKPEGDLDDGLKPNRERIGVAKTPSKTYDIFLERIQGDDPPVWLFSAETLKLVPEI